MYEHKHDATLALNRIKGLHRNLHLVLADLSHFHGSALALPVEYKGDAATDTIASTFRSIIPVRSVGDTAGVDNDVGHASTAARLPGAFQHAANGYARPLSGAVRAPNREPHP